MADLARFEARMLDEEVIQFIREAIRATLSAGPCTNFTFPVFFVTTSTMVDLPAKSSPPITIGRGNFLTSEAPTTFRILVK
jgi:hypothetical protein